MRYRHTAPRWPWFIPLALLLTGCRSPTEVELVLSTDVPCASFKGAAIFVGSTEDAAESLAPLTVGYTCQQEGQLGTIFVIPAGDKDQSLFVRIVAGVDLDATRCTANDPDRHCIVARRRLAFVPHEHLTLPIALEKTCAGRACKASETCEQGVCIDATLDPHACHDDPTQCNLPAPDGAAGQGGSAGQAGASGSSGQPGAAGTSGQGGASGGSGQPGIAGSSGTGGLAGSSGQTGAGGAGLAGSAGG